MKYDFDKVVERSNTASVKWDATEELFGEKELLPLWVADMDFKVLDEVVKAIQSQAEHGIFGYTTRKPSYYEAIIDWMKDHHNWVIEKEWICHSPGVVTALNLIVQAFSKPGDKIIVQPPVYYPFMKAIQNHDRQVVYNPLLFNEGRFEMDFEDLISKIDSSVKIILLCNPQNPGGRVWTNQNLNGSVTSVWNVESLLYPMKFIRILYSSLENTFHFRLFQNSLLTIASFVRHQVKHSILLVYKHRIS